MSTNHGDDRQPITIMASAQVATLYPSAAVSMYVSDDNAGEAVIRTFEELCHDPNYANLQMSVSTGGMFLTKTGANTTFIAMPEEDANAPITLTLRPMDYAEFFDDYSIIVERIYTTYGLWMPNPVVNHPRGYQEIAPPPLRIEVQIAECIPLIMELDLMSMSWAFNSPYDTWIELHDHIEDTCPGTRAH